MNFKLDKIKPKTRDELLKLIHETIGIYGTNCDLNFINTSLITDMNHLFSYSKFNGDISGWDVSNVSNMEGMFFNSKFKGDINDWDMSNALDMTYMFLGSELEKQNKLPEWYKNII